MKNLILFLSLLTIQVASEDLLEACSSDDDCRTTSTCEDGSCIHKNLWPFSGYDIGATCLLFFISALANSAGIGGGAINVLLLITLFNFTAHYAIPLSQAINFGGSIMAMILKMGKRHPYLDRPLIDYKMVLQLQCMCLLGTSFGILLHRMTPEWLILLALTLLLIFMSWTTGKKGIKLWKTETIKLNMDSGDFDARQPKIVESEQDKPGKGHAPLQEVDVPSGEISKRSEEEEFPKQDEGPTKSNLDQDLLKSPLQTLIERESKQWPVIPLCAIAGVIIAVCLFSLIKGGRKVDSIVGIRQCSADYVGLFVGNTLISITFGTVVGILLVRHTRKLDELGYEWGHEDIHWNKKTVVFVQLMAVTSGVASGLLGVGGGFILGPFMLSLGVNPQVSTATSSFMVLTTSFIAVLQFWLGDLLLMDYAIWVLLTATLGSFVGITVVKRIIDHYKRQSPMVLVLTFVLGLSWIIIPVFGIYNQINKAENGTAEWGFKEAC